MSATRATLAGRVRRVALLIAVLYLAARELRSFDYHDVVAEIETLPAQALALAFLLLALNYLVMTAYDWLALRYVHRSVR